MDLHIEAGTSIVGGHEFVVKKESKDKRCEISFRCSVALGPIPNNQDLI